MVLQAGPAGRVDPDGPAAGVDRERPGHVHRPDLRAGWQARCEHRAGIAVPLAARTGAVTSLDVPPLAIGRPPALAWLSVLRYARRGGRGRAAKWLTRSGSSARR